MKALFYNFTRPAAWAFLVCTSLLVLNGCKNEHEPPTVAVSIFASGLTKPMGIETDKYGNVWVSEEGTANNDAKVVLIKPNGTKYDAIINLSSIINKHSGEIQGAGHILLDRNILYVLSGNYLYKANVAGFKPGDAPMDAATIPYEDISQFVFNYPFVNNAHDCHPYNLCKGPEGDLYIADAGANAIIHRKSPGKYSVLAELPGIPNPTEVGPPQLQCVPTGILFDGNSFQVSTLIGFPFPAGASLIYKVSRSGAVSTYKKGFTSLTDIEEGSYAGNIALQYGVFGEMGFGANTGALVWAGNEPGKVITSGLNMPVAIKKVNYCTWYVTSMGDGTVLKITYR